MEIEEFCEEVIQKYKNSDGNITDHIVKEYRAHYLSEYMDDSDADPSHKPDSDSASEHEESDSEQRKNVQANKVKSAQHANDQPSSKVPRACDSRDSENERIQKKINDQMDQINRRTHVIIEDDGHPNNDTQEMTIGQEILKCMGI